MQILDIAPKDIHVTIDLTATEIRLLTKSLEGSQLKYDGKDDPEMAKAAGFLRNFFKMLAEVEDGLPKHSMMEEN